MSIKCNVLSFLLSVFPNLFIDKAIPDVRVVAFATPACADIGVSKLCEGICTSVVLHDDVVPRVTPQAVRALLKDALCTKARRMRDGEGGGRVGVKREMFVSTWY